MATGKVKWFHRKKGYGFILTDAGEDVFVHYSIIEGSGYRYLEDGEAVEFEYEKSKNGLKATSVTRLPTQAQATKEATFSRYQKPLRTLSQNTL